MKQILFVLLGLGAGVFSGFFGIGGGIILIPALIFLFGFSQLDAQGTTLAMMIPPIGILAAMQYYKAGYVNIPTALFLCAGFVFGGYLGANVAVVLPQDVMRKLFGGVMLIFSLKMIFSR